MEIKEKLLSAERTNRPGGENTMEYITIHETGNYAKGADAKAHSDYLRTTGNKVSWHYSVDEGEVWRHLPDDEIAYHAGSSEGNRRSIGVEICVNYDGNFNRACENAAELVRYLMAKHGIPIENVVQHNRWNGKNCPANLRLGGWDEFIEKCRRKPADAPSDWAKEAWESAVACGITDGLRPHDPCTREELVTMLHRAGVVGVRAS